MMEEELIKIWQSSPNQERIKFEKSRLIIDVQTSMDHFHKKVKYRDLAEQTGVLIVIPAMAYCAYAIPHLVTKLASVLTIGWAAYIFIVLRNTKKHKPGSFTESYLDYLYKTREYLLLQKKLLDNILYWYILPGAGLTMLFTMGFGIEGRVKPILKMGVVNVVLAIASYFLNKRAVKLQILPRLTKVDELINVMEKP